MCSRTAAPVPGSARMWCRGEKGMSGSGAGSPCQRGVRLLRVLGICHQGQRTGSGANGLESEVGPRGPGGIGAEQGRPGTTLAWAEGSQCLWLGWSQQG